jgi:hypothetical protein
VTQAHMVRWNVLIEGKCHCGNVSFALDWTPAPVEIPARACGCTFCTRHGGVWTSKPDGALTITVADPAKVSAYAFGTRTAHFQVCTRCGVVPVVTSEIDGQLYAVVNVNTIEGAAASMVRVAKSSFDGEEVGDRLARRKRNWIANVRFAR